MDETKQSWGSAGAPYERRGPRAAELIQCLRAIWTDPVVEFDGEFPVRGVVPTRTGLTVGAF